MYGKIFDDIFYSSLMFNLGWRSVYVFSCMIVLADEVGIVKTDPRALYRITGMEADQSTPIDQFMALLSDLESADNMSNLTLNEGRRIVPLSKIDQIKENRGWLIVNYDRYRQKGSKVDRQEYQRVYYESVKLAKQKLDFKQPSTDSRHTDTDTDTDTDNKTIGQKKQFDLFWSTYPKKVKRKKAVEIWKRRKLDDLTDLIITDVKTRLAKDDRWLNGYVPDPTTYLNGDLWEDAIIKPTIKNPELCSQSQILRVGSQLGLNARPGETMEDFASRVRTTRHDS